MPMLRCSSWQCTKPVLRRSRPSSSKLQQLRTSSTLTSSRPDYLAHVSPGTPITVALSGGVDSSVTAALLLDADVGPVRGMFMKSWDTADEDGKRGCEWEKDWEDVRVVARHLGLPVEMVSLLTRRLPVTSAEGAVPGRSVARILAPSLGAQSSGMGLGRHSQRRRPLQQVRAPTVVSSQSSGALKRVRGTGTSNSALSPTTSFPVIRTPTSPRATTPVSSVPLSVLLIPSPASSRYYVPSTIAKTSPTTSLPLPWPTLVEQFCRSAACTSRR